MLNNNLNDYDLYLFHQGTCCRAYQMLGDDFLWHCSGQIKQPHV